MSLDFINNNFAYGNLINDLLKLANIQNVNDHKDILEILSANCLVTPFDKYNCLKTYLLKKSMINDFLKLSQIEDNFKNQHKYWDICQLGPKHFGSEMEKIILNQSQNFKKPKNPKNPKTKLKFNEYYMPDYFNQAYDLVLIGPDKPIRIEVKATRARNDEDDNNKISLHEKLLAIQGYNLAQGSFQQLKAHICDVFIFVLCFTDEIVYYVLHSNEILNGNIKSSTQHRGNETEWQTSLENVKFNDKYKIQNCLDLEKSILSLFV